MKAHSNVSLEALEPRLAPAGIVAVDTNNQLHLFDSATPGTVSTVAITGLSSGTERIMGVDYRPADGKLYALGINIVAGADNDEGRIYTIDPVTGVATQVGNAPFFSTFADNNDYAFDINPAADRIRVATDRDDNLRVNPNDGTLAAADADLNPNPAIVGVAYSNNHSGAPTTTLYGIDNATDSLVVLNPPNNGTVVNVGALGVTFGIFKVGFDIEARTGTAYAVLTPTGGQTSLYTINLGTGAATLVGTVQGNPSLNGMTVALPAPTVDIVNNTTATYIDDDGDRVTINITGAPAGAAFSPDDFQFSVGQFSSLLTLNLSDDGQEWAKANITINAVPVGGMGDSFVNVSFINAAGVDLGKVMVNGDLGRIDAGLTGNGIPGLASLNVQSFGVFNAATQTSTIVGKLGGLVVKSDFGNAELNVTDTDGSITSIAITGNLDGRGATGPAGITASQSIGAVVINGSVLGGSVFNAGRISAGTSIGNLTVGGSIFGGTFDETGYIAATTTMGNVLIKGSIFGGTQYDTGYISSLGNMGNVTIKGSIAGGAVVDPATDNFSGCLYSTGDIGTLSIGGNLIASAGNYSGCVYILGTIKSATVGGFMKGGAGTSSGSIISEGLGNVTVAGDVMGGAGDSSGTLYAQVGGIANVTVGGSLIGAGNTSTGIISDLQLGIVKITGEVVNSRISAEGGTGSPAALLAIKSLSVGLGIENSQILAGYAINGAATNTAATLGPVTIGGDFVTSNMNAGAMAAITIKGDVDGRTAVKNGIFSLGAITSVNIGGNLFGGSAVDAGQIESLGAMGAVTIGGSIFGGTASYAGTIEAGTTMGNVLVKGSIFGGTDDHTGNVHSMGNMGNVTVKGSIIGGTVANAGSDLDSGLVYAFGIDGASMGAVVIGGSLIGANGDYSGSLYANGTIKSVAINGFMQGTTGRYGGSIFAGDGIGNVTVAGDLVGGAGERSGSINTFDNGSIANVTIGGSLIGGANPLVGILSANQLGAVKIAGGMAGGRISAEGGIDPANAAAAGAIMSVAISGTVQNALILGGYNVTGVATNADATIGAVTVGGNWIASSLIAGVDDGVDNLFGTGDDAKIAEGVADTLFSSITSVTIKGYAMGTAGGADHFGVVAEQIGKIKVGVANFNLAAGTDTTGILIGATGDFRVREV